jgi:outer membrane protein insertion porin family
MKNKLTHFLVILLLFFTNQSYSNPIEKISFIGLNTTIESSVIDVLSFRAGQNYSVESSNLIIEELFGTGYFSDISVQRVSDELIITVKENPFIKFFNFSIVEPNPWTNWMAPQEQLFTQEKLQERIEELNLNNGSIFSQNVFDKFISSLNDEYIFNGFYNVKIIDDIEIDAENRVEIELSINQGNKVKVASMSIIGAEKYTENELLNLFKVGEADNMIFNIFTKRDEYNSKKFDEGIQALNNYYLNSGFLDFKISSVDSNLNENNQEINIVIKISEGIQFKFGDLTFSGEKGGLSSEKLKSYFNLKKGDIFNRQIMVDDIQKIIDVYSDQGYAFVDVNPITNDFLDNINVDINISLNKKVYINRIVISGNTRTQDEVIRREIGITEGGLYSRTNLKNSILKLRRLGYFSDVQMSISEIDGAKDKLDLLFEVEETKTGSLSFSISHSNNYGIAVGTGIQEKNIFGSGNTLNADFKIANSYRRASFYFENPYFNESGHSINYGAFLSEIDDDDIMKDSYEISSKGLNFGYGLPLTETTRINTNFEYSKNDIKCGTSFSTSDYELSQCSIKNNDEFKLSLNWSENTLNNYMYPTEGRKNQIDFDIALPVADYKYYKIDAGHTSYTPLSDNLTLKINGNLGMASGYSNRDLPFYKRYFAGGSGSVRGFGSRSLGPVYKNGKTKGGELTILGSANLIAPAFFFNDSKNMRVSAFVDAGNIFEKSSSLKLDEIRMSTGVGFAYLSPIGALGFYWTTPLLKKSGDTIENFSFSLGTGF